MGSGGGSHFFIHMNTRTSHSASGRRTLVKLTALLLAFLLFIPAAPIVRADELGEGQGEVATTDSADGANQAVSGALPGSDNEDTQVAEEGVQVKDTEPDVEPQAQALMSQQGDPSSPSVAPAATQKLPTIDENSGALIYRYPIVVPPGRNGLELALALTYNNQNSDESNVFGHGWSADIPYIERINKKGADKLYTENYYSSSLDSELQSLGSGTYGPTVESGSFRTYSLASNVWTVKDKKGTVYTFGGTAASRQDNPGDSTKVAKWMLQEVRDTNDNYIKYEYYKDAGQIYPSIITYTGNGSTDGIFTVNFIRQSRSDNLKSYKAPLWEGDFPRLQANTSSILEV